MKEIPTLLISPERDNFGTRPEEIMSEIQKLRKCGARFECGSGAFNVTDQTGIVVPALLTSLTEVERSQIRRNTSESLKAAKSTRKVHGRRAAMTNARQKMALDLMAQGKKTLEILATLKELSGPSVSQSAYYYWRKYR